MWKRSIPLPAVVGAGSVTIDAQSPRPAAYYPDRDWRIAAPESQVDVS
jgi:hypothetical protein